MANGLRYLGQGGFFLVLALALGFFSNRPSYTHFPTDLAQIKLSIAHGAKSKAPCRQLTPEEMDALAPNMRRQTVCERERLPVAIELTLNGDLLYQAKLPPSGVAGDGPSRVYQRFAVAPGRHELVARLRDTDRDEGYDYEKRAEIELAAQQSLAIDFRAETGGFIFR